MPADRTIAEDLAAHIIAIYSDLEQQLAQTIALQLRAGLDAPDWAEQKLAAAGRVRRMAERLTARLTSGVGDQVAAVLVNAYARGSVDALQDLALLQSANPRTGIKLAQLTDPAAKLRAVLDRKTTRGLLHDLAEIRGAIPGADAILRMTTALVQRVEGTHTPILRWAVDTYRQVVARTAPEVLAGVATRRRAAQTAWDRLLTRGITGFTDRAGRHWNLASYVEMATRSSVAQAAVEGHLDRLAAAGLDLVIVSNAPQECERCRPWEGKVLTRGGPSGTRTIQVEHATENRQVTVHVAGTVDEAVRAGLLHPNCRHSLSAYLPGVTKAPTHTADPQGDANRQRLRALERRLRAEKMRAAAALDPATRRRHEAKVRNLQAQIRDHVSASGLHRQRSREQINLGNRPGTSRPFTTPTPPPPPPPKVAGVAAGDFSGLTRVGPQAGSNPGGLFRDADGTHWYVKAQQSERHARNEAAASALYRAAGIRTPDVHIGRGTPGLPDDAWHTASKVIPGASPLTDAALTDAVRADIRAGFGVDAWLGNWDVAGASLDNIVTAGGRAHRIDVGGSLLFRARGTPKGAAFGKRVDEWFSLRDRRRAPQASRLFTGQTPAELLAAAKRVQQIKPATVRRIIVDAGLGDDVADTLLARRKDLVDRLPTLRAHADRHHRWLQRHDRAAKGRDALEVAPLRLTLGSGAQVQPRPSRWVADRARRVDSAMASYRGSGYRRINDYLRHGVGDQRQAVDDIDEAMVQSSLPRTVLVFRGVVDSARVFGASWNDVDVTGLSWRELGYGSASVDARVAEKFTGGVGTVMRILLPDGTRAVRLSDMAPDTRLPAGVSEEAELLLARGAHLRVVADYGITAGLRRLDVEVIT